MKKLIVYVLFLFVVCDLQAQVTNARKVIPDAAKTLFVVSAIQPIDSNVIWRRTTDGQTLLWDRATQDWKILDFDFEFSSVAGITGPFVPGTRIFTTGFTSPGDRGHSVYLVQNSPIGPVDGISSIQLGSFYANVQPRYDGYAIEQFGAIAGDSSDDSEAIQRTLDFAELSANHSKVTIGPGVFNIDLGVVVDRPTYAFTGLEITGAVPGYASDQNIASSTVFEIADSTFGIAVQNSRAVHINNIVFKGAVGAEYGTVDSILYALDNWGVRGNLSSPHVGVTVDPFYSGVIVPDRYPGFSSYYTNSANGSSQVTVKNCSFTNLHTGIIISSGDLDANGDNVNVFDAHISVVKNFWVTRSSQSKGNSMEKIYGTFVQTIVYNDANGEPPSMRDLNIAGTVRQVFNVTTIEAPTKLNDSHLESIWSIGVLNGYPASINNTELSFLNFTGYPYPDEMISGTAPVYFNNSWIGYFSNCTLNPAIITENPVHFSNSRTDGGFWVQNGLPDESYPHITYDKTTIKCFGVQPISGDGTITTGRPPTANMYVNRPNLFVSGNTKIRQTLSDGWNEYDIAADNYIIRFFETATIVKTTNDSAYIISTIPESYQLNEPIVINVHPELYGTSVSRISGDTVIFSRVPSNLPAASANFYSPDFSEFIEPTIATTEAGKDTISNIIGTLPLVGRRYGGTLFPNNSYVKSVGSDFAVMSNVANSSSTNFLLTGSTYNQTRYYSSTREPSGARFRSGTIAYDTSPSVGADNIYIYTSPGVVGSAVPPVSEPLDDNDNTNLGNSNLTLANVTRIFDQQSGGKLRFTLDGSSTVDRFEVRNNTGNAYVRLNPFFLRTEVAVVAQAFDANISALTADVVSGDVTRKEGANFGSTSSGRWTTIGSLRNNNGGGVRYNTSLGGGTSFDHLFLYNFTDSLFRLQTNGRARFYDYGDGLGGNNASAIGFNNRIAGFNSSGDVVDLELGSDFERVLDSLRIAAGNGGIYEGSGNVPTTVKATVLDSLTFEIPSGSGRGFKVGTSSNDIFVITGNGDIGVNKIAPQFALDVAGAIQASDSILVSGTKLNVPDYVFSENFNIPRIEDHARQMWQKKHLPSVSSAAKIKASSYNVVGEALGLRKEVEMAHIYIQQLLHMIEVLQEEVELLKQR